MKTINYKLRVSPFIQYTLGAETKRPFLSGPFFFDFVSYCSEGQLSRGYENVFCLFLALFLFK